jgi:hypothetical protein
MADLQHLIDFEDNGGGHLEKWRHTSGFTFFEFGMFILVCVPNFIEIGL